MPNKPLSLHLPPDRSFLSVVTYFASRAASGCGLGQTEAETLGSAAEEIFLFLIRRADGDQEIKVECRSGGDHVRLDFHFHADEFDLRPLNLAAKVCLDDECGMEEAALLVASRLVDRFQFFRDRPGKYQLSLFKEKKYEPIKDISISPAENLSEYDIRPPDPFELKVLITAVDFHHPSAAKPTFFKFPGQVVDMVAGGDFFALTAIAPSGKIGGGVFWRWRGGPMVEFFGPYLMGQAPDSPMASDLLDAMLHQLVRTQAVALVTRWESPNLPQKRFQRLGELTVTVEGGLKDIPAFFTLLGEDSGTRSWCHPRLEGWLKKEYQRLVLPRVVQPVAHQGESQPRHSVLASDFNRTQVAVLFRPILPGQDFSNNLSEHLKLMEKEKVRCVFFQMDLDVAWQVEFSPYLFDMGFEPRLILPYGGRGDQIIFQRPTHHSS